MSVVPNREPPAWREQPDAFRVDPTKLSTGRAPPLSASSLGAWCLTPGAVWLPTACVRKTVRVAANLHCACPRRPYPCRAVETVSSPSAALPLPLPPGLRSPRFLHISPAFPTIGPQPFPYPPPLLPYSSWRWHHERHCARAAAGGAPQLAQGAPVWLPRTAGQHERADQLAYLALWHSRHAKRT